MFAPRAGSSQEEQTLPINAVSFRSSLVIAGAGNRPTLRELQTQGPIGMRGIIYERPQKSSEELHKTVVGKGIGAGTHVTRKRHNDKTQTRHPRLRFPSPQIYGITDCESTE